MTTKQLSVVVSAVDRMTPVMRAATTSTVTLGRQMAQALAAPARATQSIITQMTRLPTVLGAAAAALGAREVARSVMNVADEVERLGIEARRLGQPIETMSLLKFAAEQNEASFEGLNNEIASAQRLIGQFAATGAGRGREVLQLLGIDARAARTEFSNLFESLPELTRRIGLLSQNQQRFVIDRLFGGTNVLELLKGGPEALTASIERGRRLGALVTAQDVATIDAFGDSVGQLRTAIDGVKRSVLLELAPGLQAFFEATAERVADLPQKFRGISQAIQDAFSLDAGARAAARAKIDELLNATVNVLTTTALSGGRAAGAALVEGAVAALRLAAPSWEDAVDDLVLAPVASVVDRFRGVLSGAAAGAGNPVLAGLFAGFPTPDQVKSLSARLADARTKAAQLRQEITAARGSVSGNANDWLEQSIRLPGLLAELARAEDDVSMLTVSVAKQSEERAAAATASLREFASTAPAILRQGADEISAAGDRWNRALAAFTPDGRSSPVAQAEEGLSDAHKQAAALSWAVERFGPIAQRVFGGLGSTLALVKAEAAAVTGLFTRTQELRARVLAASGDERGAERIRLLIAQERELKELREAGTLGPVANQLRDVQALELARFDLMTRGASIVGRLKDAEDEYARSVERRAALVEAGTMTEAQASSQNRESAAALRQAAEAAMQAAQALDTAEPRLAATAEEYKRRVAEVLARVRADVKASGESFSEGLEQGFKAYRKKLEDTAAQGRWAFDTVASSIEDGLSSAIWDSMQRTRELGEIWRETARGIVSSLGQVASKLLAIQIIKSFIGKENSLFAALGFQSGGVVPAAAVIGLAAGGSIGGSDTVPAMLSPGEVVLRRAAVEREGLANLLALNAGARGRDVFGSSSGGASAGGSGAGAGGVSVSINVVVNVAGGGGGQGTGGNGSGPAASPERLGRAVAEEVVRAIERTPALRGRLSAATGGGGNGGRV